MTDTAKYTIDGGVEGKARLDILARVCAEGTTRLLDRAGIRPGARCLDVGCGGGHVSRDLARRVGPRGSVLGVDMDAIVIQLARADADTESLTNVEFRCDEAGDLGTSTYDVVYARCLLSHVGDPAAVIEAIHTALKPGGVVLVEDIDFTGYFCYPPAPAHERWVALYRETVRRRGGNADIGPALPRLLHQAGFNDIEVDVSQACGLTGEAKLIPALTLERITDAVVAEGVADRTDVDTIRDELYHLARVETTVMGMPRIIQTWGSRG